MLLSVLLRSVYREYFFKLNLGIFPAFSDPPETELRKLLLCLLFFSACKSFFGNFLCAGMLWLLTVVVMDIYCVGYILFYCNKYIILLC